MTWREDFGQDNDFKSWASSERAWVFCLKFKLNFSSKEVPEFKKAIQTFYWKTFSQKILESALKATSKVLDQRIMSIFTAFSTRLKEDWKGFSCSLD